MPLPGAQISTSLPRLEKEQSHSNFQKALVAETAMQIATSARLWPRPRSWRNRAA